MKHVLLSIMVLLAATAVSADECNPVMQYKIIELGVPSGCSSVEVRAFGINNRAQIVGQVICADTGTVSDGFFWFPLPSLGQPDLEIVLLNTRRLHRQQRQRPERPGVRRGLAG